MIVGGEGIHTGKVFDLEMDNQRVAGAIPNPLSAEEASEAMQIIDNDVTQEERKGIAIRLRNFINNLISKFKKADKEQER